MTEGLYGDSQGIAAGPSGPRNDGEYEIASSRHVATLLAASAGSLLAMTGGRNTVTVGR